MLVQRLGQTHSPNLNSAVVTFHHTGQIFLANSDYLQARPTLMALMVANDIPVEKKPTTWQSSQSHRFAQAEYC